MGNSLKHHLENAQKTGVLQLCSKNLTEIPNDLFKMIKVLRTLDLSDNKLVVLPSNIGQFLQLKHLTLSKNRLKELPNEIGNLKKLENVYLNDNNLTCLPSNMSMLKHLRIISLSNNKLTSFPIVLLHLPHIEVVDLSRNKICSIPDESKEFQVIELNLNQNQVSFMSEDIVSWPRVKILRLEENCLTLATIPVSILRDSQVSLLALDGNLFEMKEFHDKEGYEAARAKTLYMEKYDTHKYDYD
uniref:Leucine-rich repeat-containing protein 57 n=1 Tax=Strigamia maritima TaxID=126957 RepID=T1IV51_STRMM